MRTEAIDWLGVLATEEEIRNNNLGRSNCIVNKWDTLQFYLKVISRMPGQASNTQCTLENQKSNEEVCEQKEKNSNVVIICNDKELIKNQNIIQMTQMEFLLKNEKERKAFEQICVYKKGIHISKLRKIMQLAGEKAIFFESAQELLSFINAMEDKNENRSN